MLGGGSYSVDGEPATAVRYYLFNGKRVAMREGREGSVTYLYHDHLGSTVATSDGKSMRYWPYGDVRVGQVDTPYRYTGQRLDNSTGLYYYQARHYDPLLGRFVQPDTIVPGAANPQLLNRYSYVNNNPLRYVDPSGHFPGIPPSPSNVGAWNEWMRNTGLPWLYGLYTDNDWGSKLGVDFSTIAQAYMAGEAAAYGNRTGRAGIVTDRILAACPIQSDPGLFGLSADVKRAMMAVGMREILFDNGQSLLSGAALLAGEDTARAMMGLGMVLAAGSGVPALGTRTEVKSGVKVRASQAVARWEEFLGEGPYTNIHPRTGEPHPDLLVSADGTRSIRFGLHEMTSTPNNFHYHEEVWTYDAANNVMNYLNTLVRVDYNR